MDNLTPEEQARRADLERDRLLHLNAPVGPQKSVPTPLPPGWLVAGKVTDPNSGKRLIERELDALIDQVLFKQEVEWRLWDDRLAPFRKGQIDFGMPAAVPYYQTRIEDAWLIVEELRKRGIALSIDSRPDTYPNGEKYTVQSWNPVAQRLDAPVHGGTAPEAICRAAAIIIWMKV